MTSTRTVAVAQTHTRPIHTFLAMVKKVSEYIVKQKIIGFAILGSDSANTWVYIKSFGE